MKKIYNFIDKKCNKSALITVFSILTVLFFVIGIVFLRSLVVTLIGFLFFWIVCFFAIMDLQNNSQENLKEAKEKNSEIIELVQNTASDLVKELIQEDESYSLLLSDDFSLDWIFSYEENIDYVKENCIQGDPDSFILAACLINAIIGDNCINCKSAQKDYVANKVQARIILSVNIELALRVAFLMISSPTTYYKTPDGRWVKFTPENIPVKIYIPDGIIHESPLYKRIVNSLYRDYCNGSSISVMQLSNMLHLIYLYCRDCKKE